MHRFGKLPAHVVDELLPAPATPRWAKAGERAMREKHDALDTPEGRERLGRLMAKIPNRITTDAHGISLLAPRKKPEPAIWKVHACCAAATAALIGIALLALRFIPR